MAIIHGYQTWQAAKRKNASPAIATLAPKATNAMPHERKNANPNPEIIPWQFDPTKQSNLKRTYRRASFVLTRLLANLGVASRSPILERFNTPMDPAKSEKRWLDGLYLDQPEEWDDPYRFFRW